MWNDVEMKGEGAWNPVPTHSLLFSKNTKVAARHNIPIRRTNRYQQYYMPSQHMYCGRVSNLIQSCDLAVRKCTSPPLLTPRLKILEMGKKYRNCYFGIVPNSELFQKLTDNRNMVFRNNRPPLWSRGNNVTSHAADPGSIPGRVIRPRLSYGHHMSSKIIYHLSTDGDGLWP